MQASISVIKPTGGWKANAYIIFDYQGPTRFKFAGIDVSTNKLVMGHRDATGWAVDEQTPFQAKADTLYNLLLSVNGLDRDADRQQPDRRSPTPTRRGSSTATAYGLNYGFVGFGSDNSRGSYDNIAVQVLPPRRRASAPRPSTRRRRAGPRGRELGGRERSLRGHAAGRRHRAVDARPRASATGSRRAPTSSSRRVVRTTQIAGLAFDVYATNDLKFAALDVAGQRIVIGHIEPRRGLVDRRLGRAGAVGDDGLHAHRLRCAARRSASRSAARRSSPSRTSRRSPTAPPAC